VLAFGCFSLQLCYFLFYRYLPHLAPRKPLLPLRHGDGRGLNSASRHRERLPVQRQGTQQGLRAEPLGLRCALVRRGSGQVVERGPNGGEVHLHDGLPLRAEQPGALLDMFGMDSSDPNTVRKEKPANREARKADADADVTHRANKAENNCPTCPQKSNYVGRTFVSEGKTYTYTDEAWKQSLSEVVIVREQLAYRKAWMHTVLGELGSGKVNLDESTNPYIWTSREINAAMDVQPTIALTIIRIPTVGGVRPLGLGGRWAGKTVLKKGSAFFERSSYSSKVLRQVGKSMIYIMLFRKV
jgi:hypothetical protein